MKLTLKINLTLLILNFCLVTNAQVGIGTPDPTGVLDLNSDKYGVVLPKGYISDVENPQGGEVIEGTLFFDKENSCLKYFEIQGTGEKKWSECITTGKVSTVEVNCTSSGFRGTFINGVDVSTTNGKFVVLIENNSFSEIEMALQTTDLVISGVSGVSVSSVSHSSITLKSGGAQYVTYNLTGTLASLGDLKGDWNKLGLSCTKTKAVSSGGAVFDMDRNVKIVSFTHNTAEIQGVIDNNTNKVTVDIPYSGGSGSYDAYQKTVKTVYGTNNDLNDVTASYSGGSLNDSSGSIAVTITIGGVDSSYDIPMQGPGDQSIFASIPIEVNGDFVGNINLYAIGGIPDRSFGDGIHDFVYLPITGDDGRIWLNNNLGANYSNANHSSFGPDQQATASNDVNAYGSYIQQGRPADGHELNFNSSGQFTGTITTTQFSTLTPASTDYVKIDGKFTTVSSSEWQAAMTGVEGETNPCPAQYGYRLPTKVEMDNYLSVLGITISNNNSKWFNSKLKLPSSGRFIITQNDTSIESRGSLISLNLANGVMLSAGHQTAQLATPLGSSVRCIKDENY